MKEEEERFYVSAVEALWELGMASDLLLLVT